MKDGAQGRQHGAGGRSFGFALLLCPHLAELPASCSSQELAAVVGGAGPLASTTDIWEYNLFQLGERTLSIDLHWEMGGGGKKTTAQYLIFTSKSTPHPSDCDRSALEK